MHQMPRAFSLAMPSAGSSNAARITIIAMTTSNAPNSTFNFSFITNAASKLVTIDSATPSTNLSIQKLTISAPTGSTNTLALVNLTTNLPLQLSSNLTVDRGGVLTLTNSAVS